MARINRKTLESAYNEAQGTLDTKLSKGGLRVTSRQIAKLLASRLPYTDIQKSEARPKVKVDSISQSAIVIPQSPNTPDFHKVDSITIPIGEGIYQDCDVVWKVKAITHFDKTIPKRKRPKLSQFRIMVDTLTNEIDNLPLDIQTILASAYVWSSKTKRDLKDDLLQTIAYNLLQYQYSQQFDSLLCDCGTVATVCTGYCINERLAYVIAKRDTQDFWRHLKVQSLYCDSLDDDTGDDSPIDILDYTQSDFDNAVSRMQFDNDTNQVLQVEKLLHDSQKVQYTSEANRRKGLKEFYYNLRDSIEYDSQVIGKLDFKATMTRLPKDIRKLVQRLTDKLDDSGNAIVKRTSVLSEAEYKRLQRFAKSSKGQELKESLLDSIRS